MFAVGAPHHAACVELLWRTDAAVGSRDGDDGSDGGVPLTIQRRAVHAMLSAGCDEDMSPPRSSASSHVADELAYLAPMVIQRGIVWQALQYLQKSDHERRLAHQCGVAPLHAATRATWLTRKLLAEQPRPRFFTDAFMRFTED